MLATLPLFTNYEDSVTQILSCLTHQLYLYRVSLFADNSESKVLTSDEPIILFAAERILTYYLTKRNARGKTEESTKTMNFPDLMVEFSIGNMMPWTEKFVKASKHEDEKKTIYWIIPSLFCEIIFLSHYCQMAQIKSIKLKKNLGNLRFRIIKIIESLFKMDMEYACDTILNAWDFWYENKFYTDFLKVLI
jgi:hypothetical protein